MLVLRNTHYTDIFAATIPPSCNCSVARLVLWGSYVSPNRDSHESNRPSLFKQFAPDNRTAPDTTPPQIHPSIFIFEAKSHSFYVSNFRIEWYFYCRILIKFSLMILLPLILDSISRVGRIITNYSLGVLFIMHSPCFIRCPLHHIYRILGSTCTDWKESQRLNRALMI